MTGSSAGGSPGGQRSLPSLSLLVTHEDHAGHLFDLAETACHKGIELMVHLTGAGVLLCKQAGFDHLCRICRVMVCRESADLHDLLDLLQDRHPDLIVACAVLVRSFLACQRRLVF